MRRRWGKGEATVAPSGHDSVAVAVITRSIGTSVRPTPKLRPQNLDAKAHDRIRELPRVHPIRSDGPATSRGVTCWALVAFRWSDREAREQGGPPVGLDRIRNQGREAFLGLRKFRRGKNGSARVYLSEMGVDSETFLQPAGGCRNTAGNRWRFARIPFVLWGFVVVGMCLSGIAKDVFE